MESMTPEQYVTAICRQLHNMAPLVNFVIKVNEEGFVDDRGNQQVSFSVDPLDSFEHSSQEEKQQEL